MKYEPIQPREKPTRCEELKDHQHADAITTQTQPSSTFSSCPKLTFAHSQRRREPPFSHSALSVSCQKKEFFLLKALMHPYYFLFCIPCRVLLATYAVYGYRAISSVVLFCMCVGSIIVMLKDPPTSAAFGVPVWWRGLRPIHVLLWGWSAWRLNNGLNAGRLLLFDVLVSLVYRAVIMLQ